jgi:molybdenum cofactor cytidylyltransferase
VLSTARECSFDQLVCVLGGGAGEVRATVDLSGVEVVVNEGFGAGCSSSIAAALPVIVGDVLVLLLGDQPGVEPGTVRALVDGRGDAPLAACAYDDGRGHPFAFARSTFGELAALHGDKGVWKLLDRGPVADVRVAGPVPPDIDTWDDYRRIALRP